VAGCIHFVFLLAVISVAFSCHLALVNKLLQAFIRVFGVARTA